MKVTMIPIVTDVLGTVTKGLVGGGAEKVGNRRMNKAIPTAALLRSDRILRRVLQI